MIYRIDKTISTDINTAYVLLNLSILSKNIFIIVFAVSLSLEVLMVINSFHSQKSHIVFSIIAKKKVVRTYTENFCKHDYDIHTRITLIKFNQGYIANAEYLSYFFFLF